MIKTDAIPEILKKTNALVLKYAEVYDLKEYLISTAGYINSRAGHFEMITKIDMRQVYKNEVLYTTEPFDDSILDYFKLYYPEYILITNIIQKIITPSDDVPPTAQCEPEDLRRLNDLWKKLNSITTPISKKTFKKLPADAFKEDTKKKLDSIEDVVKKLFSNVLKSNLYKDS